MNKTVIEDAKLYNDFADFLYQEHYLICTIEEMDEIIHEAYKFVKKFNEANNKKPLSLSKEGSNKIKQNN